MLQEHVTTINNCYPEEIVKYVHEILFVYMWSGMRNSVDVHTKFDNFLDFEF